MTSYMVLLMCWPVASMEVVIVVPAYADLGNQVDTSYSVYPGFLLMCVKKRLH